MSDGCVIEGIELVVMATGWKSELSLLPGDVTQELIGETNGVYGLLQVGR